MRAPGAALRRGLRVRLERVPRWWPAFSTVFVVDGVAREWQAMA